MFTKGCKFISARILVLILAMVMSDTLSPSVRAMPNGITETPGTLDITFDSDGLAITSVGVYGDEGRAVAIQPDSKILVAGTAAVSRSNGSNRDFALLRYKSNGQLDASFDTDGKTTTDFGNHQDYASAVALQPDGKIVVAGYSDYDGSQSEIALARYNMDGSLDGSFDQDGKVTTDVWKGYDFLSSLAIQADGKIVVAGSRNIGINNDDIIVVRYNTDGSLDTSFDTDGIVSTAIGSGSEFGISLSIQPDGKILVGGDTHNGSNTDFALLRYNNNGSLDASFNTDGIATLDFGIDYGFERGGHIALQPDGKIVLAGWNNDGYFLLARYYSNGSLDLTFGTNGLVTTYLGGADGAVQGIALQSDGKIVLAGHTYFGYAGSSYDFTVMRYNDDGSVDTRFDSDGKVFTDFGSNQDDLGNAVALQPDGKIVLAGYTHVGDNYTGSYQIAVARYIGEEVLTVTKIADTNDGVCNMDCSLREAMTAISASGTIIFNSSLSGQPIMLQSSLPVIDQVLTIDGGRQSVTIDGAGSYRIFEVGTTGDLTLKNLTIQNGHHSGPCISVSPNAPPCGGGIHSAGILTVTNSTFSGNSSGNGGAISIDRGIADISNSIFLGNSATNLGGGILNWLGTVSVTNSTLTSNSAQYGGGIYNDVSSMTLTNSTFSGNTAIHGAGLYNAGMPLHFANNILANSVSGDDCFNEDGAATIDTNIKNLIENNAASPNNCETPTLTNDPMLGPPADNGGPTQSMALLSGSPALNAGNDVNCPATDQRGVIRPQGNHCDIGAYELNGSIDISIAGSEKGSYFMIPGQSKRVSYVGVNQGPVLITNTNNDSIMAAERLIYKVNGANTSFSEMMGLPNSQLDTTYWLPWYNNVDLDTQLRIANVSGSTAIVHVLIGGQEMQSSPFTLQAGESTRKSFAGVNDGPVKIVSDKDIVAAERLIYKVRGVNTSFTETMALPNSSLSTIYWLPWYNNVDLDTQLRFANVSANQATVHVFVGSSEMIGSPFTLEAGASTRLSFPGVNNGPVKIVSNQDIVAAERLIYKVNKVATSFTEMMALPNSSLNTTYWLPWYNNVDLDTQLRFANVSGATATVHVYIGGSEMNRSPFTLAPGEGTRQSFPGINNGPVQIVSDQDIVAAERLIYKAQGVNTSFSEMMALPASQLDTTYWLPWYNNVDLDTQLRFGVP